SNIPEYRQAARANHLPKRPRKLLLHIRQINKLAGGVYSEGMTIVQLKLYFNDKGRAKIEIALGKGKKLHDKRATLKKRSWASERGRLMREKRYGTTAPAWPLLNDSAGDPAAGFTGRVGLVVVAAGVNDDGGT